MILQRDRFYTPDGNIYPGGPSLWNVVDFDQRRLIAVLIRAETESDDLVLDNISKYIDDLPPDVYQIEISLQGDLVSSSNDPKDDGTMCSYRPSLEDLQCPDKIEVISRVELEELDRLGPDVDLVVCPKSSAPCRKLVFKYSFLEQRLGFVWHEMNLWMRLPKHPNIVPFHKLVVDEIQGRVVGFTSEFIPGGTLEDNKDREFKLKWLHQLLDVMDELNLNLGIAHQDVSPRNLLVDEASDNLMVFDFNYSSRIGQAFFSEDRNDIKGVFFTMYEIITRDDRLRSVPHKDQDLSAIESAAAWVKHPDVRLDRPVSEFREALAVWRERRQAGENISTYTEAPNHIDWPDLPDPPPTYEDIQLEDGTNKIEAYHRYMWRRRELLDKGEVVLDWQRPPQCKLKPSDRVLATGQLVE